MQKGFAPILIILSIVLLLGVAGGAYYFGKISIKPTDSNPKACTQEAKQCPDGSAVGRAGPNCEFSPCPSITTKASDETANWKTYTNTKYGFTANYPSEWKLSTENNPKIIFSIYETTLATVRIELYKDFRGGFCEEFNDMKVTNIIFDKMNSKRIECSPTIAINFQKDGNDFWLIANFVNDKNRDTFNKIISTFKFTN